MILSLGVAKRHREKKGTGGTEGFFSSVSAGFLNLEKNPPFLAVASTGSTFASGSFNFLPTSMSGSKIGAAATAMVGTGASVVFVGWSGSADIAVCELYDAW